MRPKQNIPVQLLVLKYATSRAQFAPLQNNNVAQNVGYCIAILVAPEHFNPLLKSSPGYIHLNEGKYKTFREFCSIYSFSAQ